MRKLVLADTGAGRHLRCPADASRHPF